jgi:hypothetical protein
MADAAEYQKLRTLKETYAAKLAKKTYENREKKLANISEMDARQFSRERALAEKIFSIPDAISGRLASEADARNCEEIIEAALRAALSYGGTP